MHVLEGLPDKVVDQLLQGSVCQRLGTGEVLFREGQPALGLYVLEAGELEVYHRRPLRENPRVSEEMPIASIHPGGVVGEMGLVSGKYTRCASVRTRCPSTVLHITRNIVDHFIEAGCWQEAILILQRIISILARKLRDRQNLGLIPPHMRIEEVTRYLADPEAVLESVEKAMPRTGFFRRIVRQRRLEKDAVLFRQGDPPDAVYFIYKGVADILIECSGSVSHEINRRIAPVVIGEVGFFSGSPRMATVKALTELEYSFLLRSDFDAMVRRTPRDAVELLLAAASLISHLIVGLEHRPVERTE